jgi:hypothetical protein
MSAMKNNQCTVLVTSCDAYRDVERPYIELFRKYWPDCPFEVVLLTETEHTKGFDRVIATGRGMTWSQMLVKALDQVHTPYVLMEMNDFMLSDKVDTELILKRLDEMAKADAVNLRLIPTPPGRNRWSGSDLLEHPKNTAYCVSCQTGIWERGYLRSLAERNKSAWEFERYGSFMVGDERRPVLVSPVREFPDVDTVHKGYWVPAGVKLLKDNGIEYDFSVRGRGSLKVRFVEWVKKMIFAIFPWTLIVRVQNLFDIGMKERPDKG